MFYAYGFTTYKKKTIMMLLTPYQPYSDPGPGILPLDAYYIYSHRAHLETQEFIRLLKEKGIEAGEFEEPVYKKLAIRAGIAAILGTNSLVYNYYHGSRFVLTAVEISYKKDIEAHEFDELMEKIGARRAEAGEMTASINCYKCGLCIGACPVGAIDYNGLTPEKCMRVYMVKGDVPDDVSEKMGGAFLGCDLCQRICPINRTGVQAMPEELKKLLKVDNFLREPKKYTGALAPLIGSNYANANRLLALCLNAAGNSGNKKYLPLIKPHLESKSEAVKRAAERAVKKLGTTLKTF